MKVIEKIERLLFKSPAWVFVMMLYGLMLIKTGIWAIPNLSMSLELAHNPFTNPLPNPEDHYIFWSWLGNYLAWLIGAKTLLSFFLFHLACNVAFAAILIGTLFNRFADTTARKALIVFSLFPVSATAYFWVGMDSLTLLIMLLALVYVRLRLVTFVLGIALGMQHFEQGILAAFVLLFITFCSTQRRLDAVNKLGISYTVPFCGVFLLGVIAGKLGLIALFHHYGIVIHSDRATFLKHNFYQFFHQFSFHAQAIIWSALGLGWLVAIRYLDFGKKTLPVYIGLGLLGMVIVVCFDQTRVMSIMLLPLILACWVLNETFLDQLSKKEVAFAFLLWSIMPWSWVWSGVPRWSAFPYDIAYGIHALFGWIHLPEGLELWPFV